MKQVTIIMVMLIFGALNANAEDVLTGKYFIGEFGDGSAVITDEMSREFRSRAILMHADKDVSVRIHSFTSSSGTEEVNKLVAEQRLKSLKDLVASVMPKAKILEAIPHAYKDGEGQFNGRFGIIEIWMPENGEEQLADAAKPPITERRLARAVEKLRGTIGENLGSQQEIIHGISEKFSSLENMNAVLGNMIDVSIKRGILLYVFLVLLIIFALLIHYAAIVRLHRKRDVQDEERHEDLVNCILNIDGEAVQFNDVEAPYKVQVKDGVRYRNFHVFYQQGAKSNGEIYYLSPFKTKTDLPIIRGSERSWVSSLKRCMRHPEFAHQLSALIRRGVIREY